MRLAVVIEIEPWNLNIKNRPTPNGSYTELPKEWSDFWKQSLNDSGINNLEEFIEGSFMVEISKLTVPQLEIIVPKFLEGFETEDPDEISDFYGGVALEYEKHQIIPQCCGSINNCSDWIEYAEKSSGEWENLWIGHPWIFMKSNKSTVEFTDYMEANSYKGIAKYSLKKEEFLSQLKAGIGNISVLRSKVFDALKNQGFKKPAELADTLTRIDLFN